MLRTSGGGNRAGRAELLATGGMAAVLAFAACSILVHFVQPELDPVDVAVSFYMNGRLGGPLAMSMVALGAGSLAIAAGLRMAPGTRDRTGALATLALWGAAVIVAGIFPPDAYGQWDRPPSASGIIHGGAAMIAFVAFPIAALALSPGVGGAPGASRSRLPRGLALLSAVALALFLACLAPAFANRPPYLLGLVERVLLALNIAWLLAAGSSVRRATRADAPGQPPHRGGRDPRGRASTTASGA